MEVHIVLHLLPHHGNKYRPVFTLLLLVLKVSALINTSLPALSHLFTINAARQTNISTEVEKIRTALSILRLRCQSLGQINTLWIYSMSSSSMGMGFGDSLYRQPIWTPVDVVYGIVFI
jgi:hypothetical protein